MHHALVGAQVLAIRRDEAAGLVREATASDEGGVVTVRNEADLHAVRAVGAGQAQVPGNLADVLLLELTQRQAQPGQNILPQAVEHVALVPGHAGGLGNVILPGGGLLHPGVMAGGDEGDAQFIGTGGQQLELHGGVAQHAGVGGASGAVGLAEGLYHLALELLARLNDLQRNAQRGGRLAGLLNCFIMGRGEADHRAGHREALLPQNVHAHRGIHTAGYAHQHLVLLFVGGKIVAGE